MDAARRFDKVSLAGHVGSGKSTVAALLADRTGWRLVSIGALFRQIAQRRGMSVLELNRYAESDRSVDDEVDGHLRDLADSDEPVVIDSRMAFHFVPESLRVYLVVDPAVGAERVHGASRRDERYHSPEEAARAGQARQRVESERYRRLYGVHRDDWRNYDLVVDTTAVTADQVASVIVEALHGPRPGDPADVPDCRLSPRRLVPAGGPDRSADGAVDVAVADGIVFVVRGADRVVAALDAGDPLLHCRLVVFEPAEDETVPQLGAPLRASVSADRVAEWERRHGLGFGPLPAWVAGTDRD